MAAAMSFIVPDVYKRQEEIIFSYPGVFAIFVYRVANRLFELGVPFLPRMMSEYANSRTGIEISPGASIGEYLMIDHGTGVVIGQTTTIGDRCKIYQGVTPVSYTHLDVYKRQAYTCPEVKLHTLLKRISTKRS